MDKLFKDNGFRIHLAVYCAVNILLIAINLLGQSQEWWCQWPLLGWGLGILGHAFLVSRSDESVGPS